MPNWKIHLEVGKRLNKEYQFQNQDLELFLLGNILPDINNGYLVHDISNRLSHKYTHYQKEGTFMHLAFLKDYGKKMNKNPLLLGYFAHLYTDYFWNENFNQKAKITPELSSLNKTDARIIKQREFRSYNNFYITNTLEISNKKKALKQCQLIDRVSLQEKDLLVVLDFLKRQKLSTKKLKYYQKGELDELLEETVTNILSFSK